MDGFEAESEVVLLVLLVVLDINSTKSRKTNGIEFLLRLIDIYFLIRLTLPQVCVCTPKLSIEVKV